MGAVLQKTAILPEGQLLHRGVLEPRRFSSDFRMRSFLPSADMAPFVAHYWILRHAPEASNPLRLILAEPSINIIFDAKNSYILGVSPNQFSVASTTIAAGIKFKPGGFYPFWRYELAKLEGKVVPVSMLGAATQIAKVRSLLSQVNDHEIALKMEHLLRLLRPTTKAMTPFVREVLAEIEADTTIHTVAILARRSGMSERNLRHIFQQQVGANPKWVLARSRFLRALQLAQRHEQPDWPGLAADVGYSSQSHLIHDFKRLTGLSPSRYWNEPHSRSVS